MTGTTAVQGFRRIRGMRIMTGNAGFDGIVNNGIYLRKAGWFRGIIDMAQQAMLAVSGYMRGDLSPTFDVFIAGTVTGFAIHQAMKGIRFFGDYIIMTVFTNFVACIIDW